MPSTQSIAFGQAGRLDLGLVSFPFAGTLVSFVQSDTLDLLNIVATSATFNAGTDLLTITNGITPVATLAMTGPVSNTTFKTGTDGAGGTLITYPGTGSRVGYEIDDGDQALKANIVRQTMTTSSGAAINGAGITIGIMSDSFNATLNGVVDPADTAALAGYLPSTTGGTSAVKILQDSTITGVENEGLAMAELVHQIAPGAAIDFYTAEGGQLSAAAGVNALVAAGANIIVDDWSFGDAPFYQVGGPMATAVANAVSSGVDYFTAAANYGQAYYENTWTPETTQLVLQSGQPAQTVTAQQFSNGTALETIVVPGSVSTTIDLEWPAPWPNAGTNAPDPIAMALYSNTGSLVATSHQILDTSAGLGDIPEITLTIPTTADATQYELAIYQTGSATVSQVKFILRGSPGTVAAGGVDPDLGGIVSSETPGGYIEDPKAGTGSGDIIGHPLVPGVNTVGAEYWANSPAFGIPPDWTEYFSDTGPGELLYDQNGNPLATPVSDGKVDFVAPDGIETSVPNFQAFYGTSAAAPDAAAVAALMLQANPNLTTAQITSLLEQSAINMNLPTADQGAGLIQATTAVELAQALCFLPGTRIATPDGEVDVAHLSPGDWVLTASGVARSVVWIGQGRVLATQGRRGPATPVIVRAGAFAPNVPNRDLHVTKGHSFLFDGVLIPVEFLVNHRSIVWDDRAREVSLYHVELETHDVLIANGAPAESYRDDGNRWLFQNANSGWDQPPKDPCAPVLTGGPIVDAVWRRLLDRAGPRPNLPLTDDPDLHLLVDGRRVDRTMGSGDFYMFKLPRTPTEIRIVTRAAAPQALGLARDPRCLGVALRRVVMRTGGYFRTLEAADERLTEGLHDFEVAEGFRWTNGNALLPPDAFAGLSGQLEVMILLGATARYLADFPPVRLARA